MIFYYIRHGDPTYNPDMLTPLGKRQAESVAKRITAHGIDEIYASSSQRAIETAMPTCEILKKEPIILDWCNEGHAWNEMSALDENGKRNWCLFIDKYRKLAISDEARELGMKWYEAKGFEDVSFKEGFERIQKEEQAFFEALGYKHNREKRYFTAEAPNDKRIAMFAHHGFGMAFLSTILDIPYPELFIRFDMCHSAVTVIEFRDRGGIVIPQVLTMSNDSHIFRDGLPTRYNNRIYI